jgi:hypothetical protein
MWFFGRLFHRHRWKQVGEWQTRVTETNIFTGHSQDFDATIILESCEDCPKERAFCVTMDSKKRIEPNFVRSYYGKKSGLQSGGGRL